MTVMWKFAAIPAGLLGFAAGWVIMDVLRWWIK